jgi:hypothetical protein
MNPFSFSTDTQLTTEEVYKCFRMCGSGGGPACLYNRVPPTSTRGHHFDLNPHNSVDTMKE